MCDAASWAPVLQTRLSNAAQLEAVIQIFEGQSADIFRRQIRALLTRPDASVVLHQVRVPTLLMAGEWNSWASPQQHLAMAELIPARPVVQVVSESGHMLMMEKPDAVASHFVRRLHG
ncbi:alpha/beta fold hydrolase [Limnohabitans sp. DM1]|uniref:alpha/beta fold hydrolase n=1 Tax=Limnohabitans sp. DM1 TaxID=1597955 RepID=UPI000AB064B7|nr:alpha/beta hydrolase [Limnohabitans sp. DM1]